MTKPSPRRMSRRTKRSNRVCRAESAGRLCEQLEQRLALAADLAPNPFVPVAPWAAEDGSINQQAQIYDGSTNTVSFSGLGELLQTISIPGTTDVLLRTAVRTVDATTGLVT